MGKGIVSSPRRGAVRGRAEGDRPGRRTSRRTALGARALAAALALGGCTMVGPDYRVPDAQLNEAWLGAKDAAAKDAASPEGFWWESFKDPTLNALIQAAARQNLTLKAAGLRVIEARARRGIAAGAFFPQVQGASAGLSASRISENGAYEPIDEGIQEASVGLGAVWELDFWGRFRRDIESADAEVLAAAADYDAVLVSLIADVATNYVLVRSLEERLGYARANESLQADTLALTETRFKAGAVSELDVAQARATLATTRSLIPTFEDGIQQAKLVLCVLLGRTPSDLDAELAPPKGAPRRVPEPPATIAAGIPADLLRRRPDVRAAERIAAARSARIGVATADLYPSISITGATSFVSADVDDGLNHHLSDIAQWNSFQGFIGLGVNWPLLNYGRIENNIRVQDALFEEAAAVYRQTVLAAAADVEAGLSAFLKAREQARHLGESVTANQRSVELSLVQYRTGAVDFIRVNLAQADLVAQQDALAVAQASVALGAVRTFRALGGGWEIRQGGEYVDPDTARRMSERTDWGDVLDPNWASGADLTFPRTPSAPAPEPVAPAPAPEK